MCKKLKVLSVTLFLICGCQSNISSPQIINISDEVWVTDLGKKYKHPDGKLTMEYLSAKEAKKRGCEYFEFNYGITGELSKSASYKCVDFDDIRGRTMKADDVIKYFELKYGSSIGS